MKPVIKSMTHVAILPLLMLLFLLPQTAMARGKSGGTERFVLDFGDSHIRGNREETATLFLKRALRDQYPGIQVKDYRLRKVVLVAKTKMGHGKAHLRVGPETTHLYRVAGHPGDFHYDNRSSFDKVRFRNPSYDSRGPWQIGLQGNFKVRKVVVVLEKKRGRNRWSLDDWSDQHGHYMDSSGDRFYFKMRW